MNEEPIKTTDTSLAAYLHYKGHYFVGMMQDPYDAHRRVFVFIKEDKTEETMEQYLSNQITVNPKGYYKSIRIMHRYLKEDNLI